MVDPARKGRRPEDGKFKGPLTFGKITGACAAMERRNYEYTIQVEDCVVECAEEQHMRKLKLKEFEWVSEDCRDVAVWVETHGESRFAAILIRRDEAGLYEVKFVADGTILEGVAAQHIFEPNDSTIRDASPESLDPDPLWLLDRKIQANIDVYWPIEVRIREMLKALQKPRSSVYPEILCGPFVGKNLLDSEKFAAHPAPLPELRVDGDFVDTWSKYAGKIKFATTYKIGPSHPRYDAWIDTVDAEDPLYFHAALPVYAGLICLGKFQGHPEWARANDVTLVGIALYVNGELYAGFEDPPVEQHGLAKYGHEACHFIPGCVSTYLADCTWVGAIFCLAPADGDMEVQDDIYNIIAYHHILRDWHRKYDRGELGPGVDYVTIEVNLVLSTSFVATVRQVCCGSVRVYFTEAGMMKANLRLHDVQETRLMNPPMKPKRPEKNLSRFTHENQLDAQVTNKKAVHALPFQTPDHRSMPASMSSSLFSPEMMQVTPFAQKMSNRPAPPPPPPPPALPQYIP
eukprot:gnl/TRDRNA2_/TRDRNA2_164531_c0_seq1.p1 gnl/TRDRNA2_/TRDRNA2_164531_c0~~gnl/TRDRNA2_/TRDRNA2_164531_c0_seq1.p1  ORF type:complete len:568 (-),score=89.56 gnl/TRDRNA2_/TRDRNA2_164531_c0_seq1:64-1614(-)